MDYYTVKFIQSASVNWDEPKRVLTIGRQNWWLSKREGRKLGLSFLPAYSGTNYSDDFWYTDMNVSQLDSVDLVTDESPTIQADLSLPVSLENPLVPDSKSWDVICEFGTAEHVAHQFNFWQNLYWALKPGGTLLVVVPCDGLSGHGLYQFSPEFFSNMSGFMCIRCGTWTYGPWPKYQEFYADGRHQTKYKYPTFVFAELRRTTALFELPVQKGVTSTHRQTPPLARFLVEVPGIRILERLFRS